MAGTDQPLSPRRKARISSTRASSGSMNPRSALGESARTASAPRPDEANRATRSSASRYSRTFSACGFIRSGQLLLGSLARNRER